MTELAVALPCTAPRCTACHWEIGGSSVPDGHDVVPGSTPDPPTNGHAPCHAMPCHLSPDTALAHTHTHTHKYAHTLAYSRKRDKQFMTPDLCPTPSICQSVL